jgi:hypothetical protein
MLRFLDIFFTIAHLGFTGFNLVGWMWKKTRKAHLVTLTLTLASWFILGVWHGWGYCFLTDWQWDVKERLGEKDLPNSFIKYFADRISGRDFDPAVVDRVTLACLVFAIVAAIYVNFLRKRPSGSDSS